MLPLVLCWSIALAAQAPEAPAAPPPRAPATPAESAPLEAVTFEAIFDEGRRLYDRFEFEKASFRFRAASRLVGLDAVSAARAHLWLGLAEAQAGDETSARASFIEAVRIDETIVLPDDAPPPLRPLFSEARASALSHPESTDLATAAPTPPQTATPTSRGGMALMPMVGASLGGVGVVLAGSGGLVGLAALAQADEARKQRFQSDAEAAFAEAQANAGIATALVVVGSVALAAGTAVAIAGAFLDEGH